MQRYFISPEDLSQDRAVLSGDDAHHLRRVMRAEIGAEVILCDGTGKEYAAKVREFHKDQVLLEIVEERKSFGEPRVNVWIAQSLPKADKLETVIQKGTEVGVAQFLPFVSSRTIVQYDKKKEQKRLQRWRKIAKEAAEQARRGKVPEVRETVNWKQLLAYSKEAAVTIFCYEKEASRQLRDVLRSVKRPLSGSILIVIGPEGGFTEAEAAEAEEAGWLAAGLGRRILRTETAGLVAASCIMYEFGEMGEEQENI